MSSKAASSARGVQRIGGISNEWQRLGRELRECVRKIDQTSSRLKRISMIASQKRQRGTEGIGEKDINKPTYAAGG